MITLVIAVSCLQTPMLCAQAAKDDQKPARSGKELYQAACAACHGNDGKGAPQTQVGFDTPLPDFSDCQFARREPGELLHLEEAVHHAGDRGSYGNYDSCGKRTDG